MIEKINRLPEVKARLGIGKSTIYAVVKEGRLNPPVRLGRRAVGWRESDLINWIAARDSETPPEQVLAKAGKGRSP